VYGKDVLKKAVILAIPRGGVATGDALAEHFGTALDVLVSKKVGTPGNPELAAGAVMHDGSFFSKQGHHRNAEHQPRVPEGADR
jgi:predicted phosphoribosyltransferase